MHISKHTNKLSELSVKQELFAPLIRFRESQQGAALISIIISIVFISIIGTAAITSKGTSSRIQIGSIDNLNGYFLAESGRNFALQYINPELEATGDPDTGTIPLLHNKTFVLPNNTGRFLLTLSQTNCPGTSCVYTLGSTGIPYNAVARQITYEITSF